MHLYLHIPFCHRICPYCSFYKHQIGQTDLRGFLKALIRETQLRCSEAESIETLYLGGGTPSMLSTTHLEFLFENLTAIPALRNTSDICLEANPATFDKRKAQIFSDLNINRISLGIQSFTSPTLQTLGRDHSPSQASESVEILQSAGIPSINIDLMFSIPGQTRADWKNDLEHAVSLKPHHISAYNLTYEEDTEFFESYSSGKFVDDQDLNADLFSIAHDTLSSAGFDHYETSNYAQPGHRSKHNEAYWQGADYIGIGPSAVSTLKQKRWKNVPDTAAYIHQIETVGHAMTEIEQLSPADLRVERIALLLRTSRGLTPVLLSSIDTSRIDEIIDAGYASFTNGHLSLTDQGRPLVDEIATHLI